MARPRSEYAATPLGLNLLLNTFTPGSRCCGNPGLIGVTPSAYFFKRANVIGYNFGVI